MKVQTRVFANAVKTIAREAGNTEVQPRLVDKSKMPWYVQLPSTAGVAPTVTMEPLLT